MRRTLLPLMSLVLGGACTLAVGQAAVYRCGNSYSQTPCAGGAPVDVGDPRGAAQRADADALAARERRTAGQLELERRRTEVMSRPAVASGFDSRSVAPAAAADSSASKAAGRLPSRPVTVRMANKKPGAATTSGKVKPMPAARAASGSSR